VDVLIGPQLAEGGFSYVFRATNRYDSSKHYALKRIQCHTDAELIRACEAEAAVHRAVAGERFVMPLLGMTMDKQKGSGNTICYMLFPLYSHSLRDIVNRRTGLLDNNGITTPTPHNHPHHHPYGHATKSSSSVASNSSFREPAPWPELRALQLFHGILMGIRALHEAGYTHRDIKLENVLLDGEDDPVLLDFGSAGPITVAIETRSAVHQIVEQASQHTTLPYRPPELLEVGGLRAGDPPVDFRAVDVWSAGCTLFALLYGASPFEGDFSPRTGRFRIKGDCTPLSILREDLPQPPAHAASASWYSPELIQLIRDMLQPKRGERPTIDQVLDRVRNLITELGGNWETNVFRDFDDVELDEEESGGIALIRKK
jgi:serine/threonine kinase 16